MVLGVLRWAYGLALGIWLLGIWFWVHGFRRMVWGVWFWADDFGYMALSVCFGFRCMAFGCMVLGTWFRAYSFGCMVWLWADGFQQMVLSGWS